MSVIGKTTSAEFAREVPTMSDVRKNPSFRRTSDSELREVEAQLNVSTGVLNGLEFYTTNEICTGCGRKKGLPDVIDTAINDANHSPAELLYALLGNEKNLGRPQHIRCKACGTLSSGYSEYIGSNYACGTIEF
ncbi:hypothetical protein RA28_20965 [Ruegeria sp. ANG-S4]|nr:hypothetical protein RA28_20965 [Ruegeria sp. ANG-S4]